jgi:hypothetical protein
LRRLGLRTGCSARPGKPPACPSLRGRSGHRVSFSRPEPGPTGAAIAASAAEGIRIDTHGRSTSYGPGGAWYETGPDAVFAQAAADRPSRFVRVMILPRALIGKSSIQYVNEADNAKPRVQQYKIFADAPIARPKE